MDIAKWMVAVVAVYNLGGLLYDAVLPRTARMHLYNPAWPPHAKFHNAQTMLLGVFFGTLALAILFGSHPLTLPIFLIAAAVAGGYFLTMVVAPLFPGTAWIDPEFWDFVPKPLGLNPQQLVTYILCALLTAAVVIACTAGGRSVARVADDPIAPCFLERWSPRAFRPEPITEAELLTMSEAAWWVASCPAPSHGVSSTLGGTRRPDREGELAAQLVVHGVDDGQVLVLEADSARCPGARTVRRSWAASSRLDLAAVRVGAEGCDAAGAEGGGRAEGVFPSSGSNCP